MCSSRTGSYCKARTRLPEAVLSRLVRETGDQLHRAAPQTWLWKGRSVKVVDGSTVSMPDTPQNQQAYPQHGGQAAGVGFPIARVVALFSLSCGTVLGLALSPWRGKDTSENALFRSLWGLLVRGDVVLGDRLFCNDCQLALLRERGVDSVCRNNGRRRVDFRTGQRLGKHDHLVSWQKARRPRWLDRETYRALPETLAVREVRVTVTQPGFRPEQLVVVTTLVDAEQFTAQDLAALYLARWQAELDLRSLKSVMQMDVLRGKTPGMVRKEIWAHLLAYNMIRTVIGQAARLHDLLPWHVSFKGALQTLNSFRDILLFVPARRLRQLCENLLRAIATHRVGDRPGRCEPRARKGRPKPHRLLQIPRDQARDKLLRTAGSPA